MAYFNKRIHFRSSDLGIEFIDTDKLNAYLSDLKEQGYKELHTSYAKGYMSRKIKGIIEPYKGRFGEGFTLHTPSWDSTQYHYITYWVKRG